MRDNFLPHALGRVRLVILALLIMKVTVVKVTVQLGRGLRTTNTGLQGTVGIWLVRIAKLTVFTPAGSRTLDMGRKGIAVAVPSTCHLLLGATCPIMATVHMDINLQITVDTAVVAAAALGITPTSKVGHPSSSNLTSTTAIHNSITTVVVIICNKVRRETTVTP